MKPLPGYMKPLPGWIDTNETHFGFETVTTIILFDPEMKTHVHGLLTVLFLIQTLFLVLQFE